MFSKAKTINSGAKNSFFSCSVNVHFSYVGRTFCLILMRCTSVLSGTSLLLARCYPLIDRLLYGTHPVNVRFSHFMSCAEVAEWRSG